MDSSIVLSDGIKLAGLVPSGYLCHAKAFDKWRAGRPFAPELLGEYFASLRNAGLSASTINTRRSAVKFALRKMAEADPLNADKLERAFSRLDRDPETSRIKMTPGVHPEKFLSNEEIATLIAKARSERQRCFIEFLVSTGCLVSELAGIKLSDCLDSGRYLRIRVLGKGRKQREVFLTHDLFERIRATFGGSSFLFATKSGRAYSRHYISSQIAGLGRAFLDHGASISAHCLRHSAATRLITKTGKIEGVSAYLGHSNISTTLQFYSHRNLSADEILA
jgi:integrase